MGGGVDADIADAVRRKPERGHMQSEEARAFEVMGDEGEGAGRRGGGMEEDEREQKVLQRVGGEWIGFDSVPGAS